MAQIYYSCVSVAVVLVVKNLCIIYRSNPLKLDQAYMSRYFGIVGIGESPNRHQAITYIISDLLSVGQLGTNFDEMCMKLDIFIQQNVF